MMRSLSFATRAVDGVLRNRASKPMSASEHAREETPLGFLDKAQWQGFAQQPGHRVLVGARRVALDVENDGRTGVGCGQYIGRLGHDADHVEAENLLDVIDAHHLAAGDPARVVAGEQQMLFHAAVALLGAPRLAGQEAEDARSEEHTSELQSLAYLV